MDYRFTLNLPNTNFSMKANLAKTEVGVLKFWDIMDLYGKQKGRKKIFVLNDGPPYANGDIHIGHAFNKILKDIVCKFKLLNGYEISFVPGWDCHGLPIELNVEKSVLKSEKIVSKSEFRLLCRQYADKQIQIQRKSFMRLGINAEWTKFYKTMNYYFELSIVQSFKTMLKKGSVYSGVKPVYWCFDCASALAEAEIEYDMKKSDSIYVFFDLCCGNFIFDKHKNITFSRVGFPIWTTTPWTLPFNEGVALNFDFDYVLVFFNGVGYILDEKQLESFVSKLGVQNYVVLDKYKGSFFSNMFLFHPFYNKQVQVVYSDHVRGDSGTGCVHIAPAYGHDDYKVSLVYNLPLKNNIDAKGFFDNDVLFFENCHIDDVNKHVIDHLKHKNNLLYYESIVHRYPFCWRHKSPLIFRTTKQWFLNLQDSVLKEKIVHNVSDVIKWIPISGKFKMLSMFQERPDWCISRQRLWGVPIILFFNKTDGTIHPDMDIIIEKTLVYIEKHGVDFWYDCDVFDLFSVDSNIFGKVEDVLDVWFDSSVVYKHMQDFYGFELPVDLCVEGSDQYRGWFQVSLINSIINYGIAPYRSVLTHGFILDSCGRKMSKSLNNVISPNDVVDKYGADVLRLWVSSVNYCFDVNISEEILSRICEAYRKFRNTFRFLLSNLHEFEFFDGNFLLKMDAWIINRFQFVKLDVLNDYLEYKFYSVYQKLYNFCVDDLGSRYLDIIKDRLYTLPLDSIGRKSAQSVLFHIVYGLSKLLAPILSFTAEEVWKYLKFKDTESVFLSNFNFDTYLFNKNNVFDVCDFVLWDKLFLLKSYVNRVIEDYRKCGTLGSSLDGSLYIFCNIYWYDLLIKFKDELYLFFLVSSVEIKILSSGSKFFKFNELAGISFNLKKSVYLKCERCWHRRVDNVDNLVICERCINNLYYDKESRLFV